MMARNLEKLASTSPDKIHFALLIWNLGRIALYGVVLFRAYWLDRESYHGLVGALAGLFISYVVLVFVGITGMDMQGNGSPEADE